MQRQHSILKSYIISSPFFSPCLHILTCTCTCSGWVLRTTHMLTIMHVCKLQVIAQVIFCAFSFQTSPENVYAQMAQNLLYPSYTYSHISGGDPIRILDLSVFLILHEFVWLLFYCLQISTLMQIIQCVLIIIIVT